MVETREPRRASSSRSTSHSDSDRPGQGRPFRRGFHALRGVLLRQANDAETGAVAHLRVRLVVQDSFEQLRRMGPMLRAQFTIREGGHSRWA